MTVDEMLELMSNEDSYPGLVTTEHRPLPHKVISIDVDEEVVLLCAVNDDYKFWCHVSMCCEYDLDIYE